MAKEIPSYLNFITNKSYGKLIYPSDDSHKICMECESIFREEIFRIDAANARKQSLKKPCFFLPNECNVLSIIGTKHYFPKLMDHAQDNDPLDNHYIHLLNVIIKVFMKVRLCYYYKILNKKTESVRQSFTKTIQFQGFLAPSTLQPIKT